jgi:hypothetical protein
MISFHLQIILLKENLGLIWVIGLVLDGLDLIKMTVYFYSNLDRPSTIQRSGLLFPYSADEIEEAAGWCHGLWQESLSWYYDTLIFDLILPMQSRRHKGSVPLTWGSKIGSQRASDVGAAQVGFNGDEVLFW